MGAAGVEALERGLHDLREEVRRAACWGLSSPTLSAAIATPPLLRAATSAPLLAVNGTSVRKHAAFALGENGEPTKASCSVLRELLLTDTSTWVRAAAAGALGCLGIRAAKAAGASAGVIADAMEALLESLKHEVGARLLLPLADAIQSQDRPDRFSTIKNNLAALLFVGQPRL
eukprot:COSAG02_NODE_1081_length_14706_cov_994.783939_3_plen_174_part_00